MKTPSHQPTITATGSGARKRLLEAATDIFGRHGYDAATTRMIARLAGANISAIPYYFNGKEGLYKAVVRHIVDLIAARLEETWREVAGRSFNGPEAKEEAVELLEQLVDRFIRLMVGSPEAQRVSRIILREQLYPTAAYDLIFTGFMEKTLEAFAKLIMVISKNRSERMAKMRSMAIVGQVMAFRVARETMIRSLDLKGYSDSETAEIDRIILEHTRFIAAGLVRENRRPMKENGGHR